MLIFPMSGPAQVQGLSGETMPNDDSVKEGPLITISYSLTRMEIVGYFLRSLPKSPRMLLIVGGSSLLAGAVSLAASGPSLRTHMGEVILNSCGLAAGVFCFFVFLVFVQAKTQERTLSVAEDGISTRIGKMSATIPWAKIATVKNVGRHILIVRSTGNSFLIPVRAFQNTGDYARFLETAQEWLKASS